MGLILQGGSGGIKLGGSGNGATVSLQNTAGHSINQTPANTTTQQSEVAPKSTSSSSSSSGNGDTDPALAAFYADQINALNALLGGADTTLNQGRTGVQDTYNKGASRLNEDQSKALRDIGIKRETNDSSKKSNLAKIDDMILRSSKGAQRMFSTAGSGISGAAQLLAPAALSAQGSDERADAFKTYGENARNLDISEDDTNGQYKRGLEDLGSQRNTSLNDLESGVAQQKLSLIDAIKEAQINRIKASGGGAAEARNALGGYSDMASNIRNALASLFDKYRNPTLSVTPISVDVPELSTYTADPLTQSTAQTTSDGSAADTLPYYSYLKKNFGLA